MNAVPEKSGSSNARPQLRRRGNVQQLYVDDQPFIVLGGEVHNSSSTSREWMAPIWEKLGPSNFNTVLAVVPWDLFEPEEGFYDYTIIDDLIADARIYHKKLIPLWFGSWKNGATHYAPLWVKTNTKRFPRIRTANGTAEVLTPISAETRKADSKAFAALMQHIREVDSEERTVIMVQVQNEPGLNGDSRDRSPEAEALFQGQVPVGLTNYLKRNEQNLISETLDDVWKSRKTDGTWTEVFGFHANEAFMAWHYAHFLDGQAEAGKAEYDIPMFVNVWISLPEHAGPGSGYPSGGAVNHMQDIWRAGAPHLDIIAPDIYHPDFPWVVASYNRGGNPLFIPESKNELEGGANAVYALGRGAVGFSAFAIETRNEDLTNGPLSQAYGLLASLAPQIVEHQAAGTITSGRVSREYPRQIVEFGGYKLTIELVHHHGSPDVPHYDYGYCIVMQTGPDSFLTAGLGAQIKFDLPQPNGKIVALGSVDEGQFIEGKWQAGRRLSGDEIINSYQIPALLGHNQTGTGVKFWRYNHRPHCLKVQLYSYDK